MIRYVIKKNGFDLFEALGRRQAIERINKHLDWSGLPTTKRKWITNRDMIRCISGNDLFTMEKKY